MLNGGAVITLEERFSALVHRHIPGFTPRNGRGFVLCLFHQEKTPSLSINLEKAVFHCFGCGAEGGVKRFAELVGEPWGSTRSESRSARAHRAALAAARNVYQAWQRQKLIALTDEYRDLIDECEIAEIGYRATVRQPSLYGESERSYWAQRLAALYDRFAVLEYSLDILTYKKYEAERLAWWRGEVEDGQLAA